MSNVPVTIGGLVNFVMTNRRGNAFKGMNRNQVAKHLTDRFKHGMLFYAHDGSKFVGVLTTSIIEDGRTLFVEQLLTSEPGVLNRFAKVYLNFAGLSLAARRRGNIRSYNLTRLLRHLTSKIVTQQQKV